ncbi:MAG: hypothetical protein ABIY52_17365 [Gemmatimonadaceae bacterium]
MSDRILRGAFGALLFIGTLVGCTESVTSTLGCPELCSDQSAALRDTILVGSVAIDTTFLGYPRRGEDRNVTLRNQTDTADIRLVARYDSLPSSYQLTGATSDSTIRLVDSAQFIFVIDTLTTKPTAPITIEAFDVDTTSADTLTSALIPLFRSGRLIGSQTYLAADFTTDTIRLPLNNAAVFAKVRDTLRLRIGLRVTGLGNAQLRVLGNSFIPRLRMRVSADTTVQAVSLLPRSKTPTDDQTTANSLVFFPLIVAGGQPAPPPGMFTIGGIAGARTYIRFDIPTTVLDSVQVIRASLLLTQAPARGTAAVADSVTIFTAPVLASPSITDILTASSFVGSTRGYGIDSVRFSPRGSGVRSIELVNLLRFWRDVGTTNTSRSIVLSALEEGSSPGEANFYSSEAAAALRPRLRLTFVPRRGFGIP